MPKPYGQWELTRPDELEAILKSAPVAYVPLGTYEHHGWHLPVCFDGIKAHELCLRMAKRTGGVVLPTFFYGTGGGHIGYKWTIIVTQGRDASQVTLPETPRKEGTQYDPTHPLYAIWGQDPRQHASRDIGNRVVNEIVNRVAQMVEQALASF